MTPNRYGRVGAMRSVALAWHSLSGALQAFTHQRYARAGGVISEDGSRQPVCLHHQPLTLVLETSSHNEQGRMRPCPPLLDALKP